MTGCITSLVEKKTGKETIAAGSCANELQAFRDKPKDWDAWNIDADFEKEKFEVPTQRVIGVEMGPLAAAVRVSKKFRASEFIQTITVYSGIPRVDIVTDADWHEQHILIKAAMPVTVQSDKATYEIPYGAIQRPTTRNNPVEQAMFEVPALRWADLSDADHGLSLLNDSKYGYDGKDNVLRLSLLRGPTWPDPYADQGKHHFTYSLYPHAGGWKQAGTVRRGYELNYKLQAMQVGSHTGSLPAQHSFASVDAENVVLTAVKKAEDDDALLFRFYEWAGKKTDVKLTLPAGAESAREANLKEVPGAALQTTDGSVTVPTNPYEIKTVAVTFKGKKR
jgi:alpha-mannosidase